MAAHEAIDGVLDRVGKHAYEKYLQPRILPHAAYDIRKVLEQMTTVSKILNPLLPN